MNVKKKRFLGIQLSLALMLGMMSGMSLQASAESTHTHEGWAGWTGDEELPSEPGSYYLTKDVVLTDTWMVPAGTTNLCLNGHTIRRNEGLSDNIQFSMVTIDNGATLKLYDENNTGSITGGLSPNNGGGVNICGGSFEMFGGSISENFAGGYGGGVCLLGDESTFVMAGGIISDNQAGSNGGGIYVRNNHLTLSGNVTIKDNLKSTYGNNVYIYDGKKITITDALTNTAPIGIAMGNPGIFTNSTAAGAEKAVDYIDNFTSDNSDFVIRTAGNELKQISLVNVVKNLINAIPDDPTTTEGREAVTAARGAYDELREDQKDQIPQSILKILTGAEKAIEEADAAARLAEEKTTAAEALDDYKNEKVGTGEPAVYNQDGLNALESAVSTGKTNINSAATVREVRKALANAKAAMDAVKTIAEKQVDAVVAEITALPEKADVTTDDEEDIVKARGDYNALTDDQKDLVLNSVLNKLKNAEAKLAELKKAKDDQDAADAVTLLINAIPDDPATDDVRDAVAAARGAYDALTKDQKDLIDDDTLEKLTGSEEKLVFLQVMSEVSAKTGRGMIYSGNEIQLINTPTTALPAGHTMNYAVTTENTAPADDDYTTSVPAKTDAGTYYVWYKIVCNDDHDEMEAESAEVTIAKRAVTLTSATAVKSFDGTALTNANVNVTGDGFAVGEGVTFNVTGNQTGAGSSKNTFTYVLNNGTKADNYEITMVEGTLTVEQVDSSGEVTAVSGLVYDGTAKALVESTVHGGTFMYRLGTDGEWTEEIPEAVDFDTYTVYYYIKGDGNHRDNGSKAAPMGSAEVTIKCPFSNEWVDGKWYNKDGTQTYLAKGGWKKDGSNWKYEDTAGWYAKSRWLKIDFKWYYFDKKGHMQKDAYVSGAAGKIYYIQKDGTWDEKAAVTGWKKDSKGWWFGLYGDDCLSNTWKMINGNWYYFKADGYMAQNEFVGGWWCNKNGVQNDPVKYSWHKTESGWWYGAVRVWYAKDAAYIIDGVEYSFDQSGYCTNP